MKSRRIAEQHQQAKLAQVLGETIAGQSLPQERARDSHNRELAPSHVSMSTQQMRWHQARMALRIWQMTLWMKLISFAQLWARRLDSLSVQSVSNDNRLLHKLRTDLRARKCMCEWGRNRIE
jgi:ABC-type multidrug transport system fused ATPase/permease subunit